MQFSRRRRAQALDRASRSLVESLESRTLLHAGLGGLSLFDLALAPGGHAPVQIQLAAGNNSSTTLIAPSALTATAGTSSIALKWTDQSSNESGFRIYRSTDGVTFAQIASVGKQKTAYSDSQVSPGVTYTYRVAAYNSTTTSAYSNTASAVIAVASAPAAPGNFTIFGVTTSSATLSWSDVSGESGYHIYRSTDGSTYTLIANGAANTTTYIDSNLAEGTTYYFKVAAWNSAGEAFSPVQSITSAVSALATTSPVTVSTVARVGFSELRIDGTTGNDSILVTQSGSTLTVAANGATNSYTGPFGDLVIYGISGNDTITVDSSVTLPALVYAGDGSDVIRNLTTGKATIVTIGAGLSTVTGNGANTSFWVNPGDTVNASTLETTLGGVNRVGTWYQPWTTDTSSADYIQRGLYGQNLRDPSDAGVTMRLSANSFWGAGPTINDINQTSIGDCYYLAPMASLAYSEPARLQNLGVDLGDGTYAVKYVRNGVTSYVRVDADLSTGGWNWGLAYQTPGTNGNLWGSIFEKAYAFFRTGANSYSSLNYGYQDQTLKEFGVGAISIYANSGASSILNAINTQLSAGHAVVSNTLSSVTSGAPLIASHVYSVIGAYTDSTGTVMIRLRNPWGVDGAGNDGLNDGIVTITYATYASNFNVLTYASA